MPALERLYTIAPSFRAEKSRTRRHLTEFWHAEMEIAWASNDDVMKHGEGLVRHIAKTLLEERSSELESLGRNLEDIRRFAETPFPRISYDEAVRDFKKKELKLNGVKTLTTQRKRYSLKISMSLTSSLIIQGLRNHSIIE